MLTKDEVKAKLTCHWANIFHKGWWGNPAAKGKTGPKIGMGKGEAWFDMYEDICKSGIDIKTMLNVGVGLHVNENNSSVKWLSIYEDLFPSIDRFVTLEIDQDAVDRVAKSNSKWKKYFNEIHVDDIRNIDNVDFNCEIDLLLWSHGPEHVYREDWKETFEKLKKVTKVLIIGLPWGSGYDAEPTHFSRSVRRGEFEEFGFKMRYVGVEDTMTANMFGWIINKEAV